jgi:Uncharacterised protein family (UPF0158)
VETGLGTRLLRLPERDSQKLHGYAGLHRDHRKLTIEVRPQTTTILGRDAFRRFKDVLAGYPTEIEPWFAFKAGWVRQRVLAWPADEGGEPVQQVIG